MLFCLLDMRSPQYGGGTMPELPEVEVTRRGLLAQLPGKTVRRISCSKFSLRQRIPRRLLQSEIVGQEIRTIDRRGKHLLVRMTSGAMLVIHLGMTGKLGLIDPDIPRHRHDHVILSLDTGLELRFNDSRRFGFIAVWPADEAARLETQFSQREGIEPFGSAFTAEKLHALAATRRIPVKTFLMNSKIIAGIGNIYANEILFATGIHPAKPVHRIRLLEWQKVVAASREILQQAIDAGGSTISDFLGTNGHPGYFQLQFRVYGRKDQACVRCATPIVKTEISGRATFYCPNCQKGM